MSLSAVPQLHPTKFEVIFFIIILLEIFSNSLSFSFLTCGLFRSMTFPPIWRFFFFKILLIYSPIVVREHTL